MLRLYPSLDNRNEYLLNLGDVLGHIRMLLIDYHLIVNLHQNVLQNVAVQYCHYAH